jgi:hypothetical protein
MTLLEYIEKQWTIEGKPIEEIFRPGEWNEVVRLMYILLKRAILDGANRFTIAETRFYWSKDEQILHERPCEDLREYADNSLEAAFNLILERDEVIRRHLKLLIETDKELTFQIPNK